MTVRERNIELLEQTMQFIKDHPERHRQDLWVCGTSACFAGHAALLAGFGHINSDAWIEITDLGWVAFGASLLGLTEEEADVLFAPLNTIVMLEHMVKDLVNGDQIKPIHVYYAEEAEPK